MPSILLHIRRLNFKKFWGSFCSFQLCSLKDTSFFFFSPTAFDFQNCNFFYIHVFLSCVCGIEPSCTMYKLIYYIYMEWNCKQWPFILTDPRLIRLFHCFFESAARVKLLVLTSRRPSRRLRHDGATNMLWNVSHRTKRGPIWRQTHCY